MLALERVKFPVNFAVALPPIAKQPSSREHLTSFHHSFGNNRVARAARTLLHFIAARCKATAQNVYDGLRMLLSRPRFSSNLFKRDWFCNMAIQPKLFFKTPMECVKEFYEVKQQGQTESSIMWNNVNRDIIFVVTYFPLFICLRYLRQSENFGLIWGSWSQACFIISTKRGFSAKSFVTRGRKGGFRPFWTRSIISEKEQFNERVSIISRALVQYNMNLFKCTMHQWKWEKTVIKVIPLK